MSDSNLNVALIVDNVEEFQCSAIVASDLSLLLKKHRHTVNLARWRLAEEEPLRVHVDAALGSDFRSSLQRRLEERIASCIEIHEPTEGHMDVLRLNKLGEDDAEIRGPAWLTGSDDPVQPLNLKTRNSTELAAEAALALAHLARFRQILQLGAQRSASMSPPLFTVSIEPAGDGTTCNSYPLNQQFKFTFTNNSEGDLHYTVFILSPEFSILQLFPPRDYPYTVEKRQRKGRSFKFSITLPEGPSWVQESLRRTHRRDIVRTLVTRGKCVSWKSLELPNIWDTGSTSSSLRTFSTRGGATVDGLDVDWWCHDKEIVTGSTTHSPVLP